MLIITSAQHMDRTEQAFRFYELIYKWIALVVPYKKEFSKQMMLDKISTEISDSEGFLNMEYFEQNRGKELRDKIQQLQELKETAQSTNFLSITRTKKSLSINF